MDASRRWLAVVFMKAGMHGSESLESILARKAVEEERAGAIYWGYGGVLCHPTTQVQPFAGEFTRRGCEISVVMLLTRSKHQGLPVPAREMSVDGVTWTSVPDGATVTSSKFALVLRDLRFERIRLDLSAYDVATGAKRGSPFDEYFRGRVDKGCAHLARQPREPKETQALVAGLEPPYAVFLR